MDKVILAVGGAVVTIAALIIIVPLSTFAGAFSGWVVRWFFGATILDILSQLGIAMWQFGAFIGFVGGFLKTKVSAEVTQK